MISSDIIKSAKVLNEPFFKPIYVNDSYQINHIFRFTGFYWARIPRLL